MTTNDDMITRCPQCTTAFRVTQELLNVANGAVRCGSCLSVFKAAEYFINNDPQDTEKVAKDTSPSETETTTEPSADAAQEKPKNKGGIGKKLRNLIQNDDDDILIHDDLHKHSDDNSSRTKDAFDFEDKGFDVKIESGSNHFEANNAEPKHSTREKADESWAMDLLAEIEDDDIQPINIKRQNTAEPTPTDNLETIAEAPAPQVTPTHKPQPTIPEQDRRTSDDNLGLNEQETNSDTYHHTDFIAATKDDNLLLEAEIDSSTPISDEEIENAIHYKTAYASGNASMMNNLETDSIDMEWSETTNKQRWLWLVGTIVMALLLILQVAWLRFDTLSKQAKYRPYYAQTCKVLGCELPKLLDINKIRANNLVVRSHPEKSDALIVDVILVNTASFDQSYPALRLEFSGINDEPIANRNFQPREYLKGELAGSLVMRNNQPIQLSLELVDPGETAVNYRITAIAAKSTN